MGLEGRGTTLRVGRATPALFCSPRKNLAGARWGFRRIYGGYSETAVDRP